MRDIGVIRSGLISDALKNLRKTGFSGLCKKVWLFVWVETALAPFTANVLGEITHEKIAQSLSVGYWPQIKNPRTFNEKIANRKLFTNDELFTIVSDKYAVRDYVREKVGDEVLNPVYHVTDDPDTIPFESLPSKFVIKSTHGSGQIIIVDDKEEADIENIRSQCSNWLDTEFGQDTREYWYSEIEPKILVERRIQDSQHKAPLDFKIFVFNGSAEYIQVNIGRFSDLTERFYDTDWNPMEFTHAYEKGPKVDEPAKLDRMIEVAEALGEDFEFVRVDLYQTDDTVIFGELTLAPGGGYLWFSPKKWDFKLGNLW